MTMKKTLLMNNYMCGSTYRNKLINAFVVTRIVESGQIYSGEGVKSRENTGLSIKVKHNVMMMISSLFYSPLSPNFIQAETEMLTFSAS